MKRLASLHAAVALMACANVSRGFFDSPPAVSFLDERVRIQLRGTMDMEAYRFDRPAPGLIFTPDDELVNPRAALFLDAQIGSHVYVFAQTRIDRGFDPTKQNIECRLDEYALRYTPWKDGRFNIQIGKFATVVGSWVSRHGSWENPFITAPAVYENVTAIWDTQPPSSIGTLLRWAFVRPQGTTELQYADKHLRIPVIWGPSYATGAAVAGKLGKIEYAAEVKNQSLSSRPEYWTPEENTWSAPTFSGRLAWRPSAAWTFGISSSSGSYLPSDARPSLAAGRDLDDYRQLVVGQEIGFAWRHWQVWFEAFQSRFEIPDVADADVFSWYVETKYKFTPQFFGALRWNEQTFGHVTDSQGSRVRWGRNLRRLDLAPGYRFSEHTQLKLQWSLQHEESARESWSQLTAVQFTVRF
jgi:hypothetical protein